MLQASVTSAQEKVNGLQVEARRASAAALRLVRDEIPALGVSAMCTPSVLVP